MELARNLKTESVSRLQPTEPRQIAPEQSVADAVELMRTHRVGCLLVSAENRLLGIFTERDLLHRVLYPQASWQTPVSHFMTPNPVTVHLKESISTAIRRMQTGGYRHLPVLDQEGQPVGILSVRRIIHYLAEHFPDTVFNQPPDPNVVPQLPEGA